MPYPSQINVEGILSTARIMIENEGAGNLSLNKLAAELGVKTPSLYRYFKNKNDLLRAINEETENALMDSLADAMQTATEPEQQLLAMAQAFWRFSHENPALYGLLFTNTMPELTPDSEYAAKRLLSFQKLIGQISGDTESLTALRGLLALMHGFVMLVLAGQLRRGGDLHATYLRSLEAYLKGWEKP